MPLPRNRTTWTVSDFNALAESSTLDQLAQLVGYKSWNYNPALGANGTAPTAGTIYVAALPLFSGQVLANTVWQVQTAAVGTVPTDIFCGICDSTGKMTAQSTTLKNSSIWTASGYAVAPLSANYTVASDGLYYGVFLQVGSWGTTALALGRGNNIGPGGVGTTVFGTAGAGQTVLPANGSSLAIVTTNGLGYFVGVS